MGELNLFNLQRFIDLGCKTFVETGTGKGDGLAHALKYPFNTLWSIEVIKELAEISGERFFGNERVHILNQPSLDGLELLLQGNIKSPPILFWLDAHFPGADFHYNDYEYLKESPLHMPLNDELALIRKYRPNNKDCFIIDDMQLYMDIPVELKNNDFTAKYGNKKLDILENPWPEYNYEISLRHQGFLILTPKK
jgi:hypothetical protein